jgi:hypothetical protein
MEALALEGFEMPTKLSGQPAKPASTRPVYRSDPTDNSTYDAPSLRCVVL